MVAGARLAGRPAVLQFHAHGLEQAITDGGRSLRVAVRSVTALANATVVLHEAAAGALRSTGGGSPIHVVPNWVEVPDRPGDLPPQPPLRVVFVGGLVRRKGVPLLLEAVRSLKGVPVTLTLVGGAAEDRPEALDRLYAEADDLVSAGRVRFTGELDAAGVRAELRAAHLFVLPSEAEGMPMALLEAMAEGRAVLVSDAGNMRSVVEKAACGWVLPDRRPATIAACIRRIAEGPAGLATASAAAWEAAREGYSAEARHTQIDAILVSLRTPPDRRSEASG
jgi:glycosyltransferase involved in cell wall biosynthesis